MKGFAFGVLCSIWIMCLWSGINTILILHTVREAYTETITAYTPEDIIYLEGKHVFSESGRYDIQCSTRSHALDVFEELTVSHVNNQQ